MNNKTIRIILIILGLILVIGAPTFAEIYQEEIHHERPCVDGHGDVNLEGIMCDKVEYSLFGIGGFWTLLVVSIPMFLGLILIVTGLTLPEYCCSEED